MRDVQDDVNEIGAMLRNLEQKLSWRRWQTSFKLGDFGLASRRGSIID